VLISPRSRTAWRAASIQTVPRAALRLISDMSHAAVVEIVPIPVMDEHERTTCRFCRTLTLAGYSSTLKCLANK